MIVGGVGDYGGVSGYPVLARCFDWIRGQGGVFVEGIATLEGDDLYVNVHGYVTKPREACKWESHRHTVDLQYCIAGTEIIDWSPARLPESVSSYNEPKDTDIWSGVVGLYSEIRMEPGMFTIFLPGELHRPMVSIAENQFIRKLVFKIAYTKLV